MSSKFPTKQSGAKRLIKLLGFCLLLSVTCSLPATAWALRVQFGYGDNPGVVGLFVIDACWAVAVFTFVGVFFIGAFRFKPEKQCENEPCHVEAHRNG